MFTNKKDQNRKIRLKREGRPPEYKTELLILLSDSETKEK